MEKEKAQQNSQETNQNVAGSQEPALGGFGNLKLNQLESAVPSESVISQLNTEEAKIIIPEDVKLEKINIKTESPEVAQVSIKLGESGIFGGDMKKKYRNQYRRLFLISFFVILISGLTSIVLRLYSRYLYFAAQPVPDATYQQYIDIYKKGQRFIDKTLNISDYQKYLLLSLEGTGGKQNVANVIADKKLSYIQKKDVLQQALNGFFKIFLANTQELNSLKEGVSKYGFFSEELYYLFEDQDYSTSIKKYLLSLEIIKFSSAIKVFSYLDTFVSSLANSLQEPIATVQEKMKRFADRGEKDILVYLNNCYLNPYEIDYDCNMIGDFDRYYDLIDKETPRPDTNFFKKMIHYVDNKLEQTDIPSFSITFKKYDPMQQQISFTVDVNTFKQDEIALIKKGIINPHIFIITNLLNLIKQSAFVVTEDIDAKSVKIVPKVIKIGSSTYIVNHSTMDFVLPIQAGTKREISDYIDPIFTSPK